MSPNAIRVFQEFKDAGKPLIKYGIRLTAVTLHIYQKKPERCWTKQDSRKLPSVLLTIWTSSFLHDLKMQGAAIDSWGVGTNLITSKDCPSFGGVYKLAAIQNEEGEFVPKIKISENTEKITNPGNKTIYRIYEKQAERSKLISSVLPMKSLIQNRICFSSILWILGRRLSLPVALTPYVKFSYQSSRTASAFTNLLH